MVIEQLSFVVPVDEQARFLAADTAIWTAVLAAQPGYLGKETWREAADPARLHLIIRWENRAAWKAVPAPFSRKRMRGLLRPWARPIRCCAAWIRTCSDLGSNRSRRGGGDLDLDQEFGPRKA